MKWKNFGLGAGISIALLVLTNFVTWWLTDDVINPRDNALTYMVIIGIFALLSFMIAFAWKKRSAISGGFIFAGIVNMIIAMILLIVFAGMIGGIVSGAVALAALVWVAIKYTR